MLRRPGQTGLAGLALATALTTAIGVTPALAAATPASHPSLAQLRAGVAAQQALAAAHGQAPRAGVRAAATGTRPALAFGTATPGQVVEHTDLSVTFSVLDPSLFDGNPTPTTPTGSITVYSTTRSGAIEDSALATLELMPVGGEPGVAEATYQVTPSATFPKELHDLAATYTGDDTYAERGTDDLVYGGAEIVSSNGAAIRTTQRLYYDLLGRPADASGQAYWQQVVQDGGYADASYAFSLSQEKFGQEIDAAYALVLGRPVDAEGRAYYQDLFAKGLTPQALLVDLLSSQEFEEAVGPDNGDFVDALYVLLLGREPDAEGRAYYVALLDAKRTGRANVAYEVVYSDEHLGNELEALYLETLDRDVDDEGASYWSDAIRSGYRTELVGYSITLSGEYRDLLDPK